MFVKITLATSYKPNICGTNRRMQATETGSVETSHNPASSFVFGACFELAFFWWEWCVFMFFWVRNSWAENGSMSVSFKCLIPLCAHFLGPKSEPATARDFKATGDKKQTVVCKLWWLTVTITVHVYVRLQLRLRLRLRLRVPLRLQLRLQLRIQLRLRLRLRVRLRLRLRYDYSYDHEYDYEYDYSYDYEYDYGYDYSYDYEYDYEYDYSYDYGYDYSYDYEYDYEYDYD